MKVENIQSQMRKGVLEYCILSIIKNAEVYPGDIIDEMNVIYNYNKSKKDYLKELDSTFDELAVKYNLQHYRGNNIR